MNRLSIIFVFLSVFLLTGLASAARKGDVQGTKGVSAGPSVDYSYYRTVGETYTTTIDARSCSDSDAITVNNKTELQAALADNTKYTICMEAADYSEGSGLVITRAGTSSKSILFRPTYSDYQAPWNKIEANVPRFSKRLNIEGQEYLTFIGLIFKPARVTAGISGDPDNSKLIFDNNLFEGTEAENQLLLRYVKDVWVQNNVFRSTAAVSGQDRQCILLTHINDEPVGTTQVNDNVNIINNEIYDCRGDGLQLNGIAAQPNVANWEHRNIKVVGNHFYLTSNAYVDCSANAMCAGAENAIDTKYTSTTGYFLIKNNIFNGYRETLPSAGGTGDEGHAVLVHGNGARNVVVDGNVFFDSAKGFSVGADTIQDVCVSATNNFFYDIAYSRILTYSYSLFIYSLKESVYMVNNTMVYPEDDQDYQWGAFGQNTGDLTDGLVSQNIIIENAEAKIRPLATFPGTAIYKNTFINAQSPPYTVGAVPDENLEYTGISLANWFDQHCFIIKPLTDPTTYCIPHAIPKAGSGAGFLNTATNAELVEHPTPTSNINTQCPNLPTNIGEDLLGNTRSVTTTPGAFNPK